MNDHNGSDRGQIVGIDLDNTIAIYDDLLWKVALQKELIKDNVLKNKKQIRDAIRVMPDGEVEWQKLQGLIYGPRMFEAKISPNILGFIETCQTRGTKVHIVSHKTQFASYDPTETDLRQSAMKWMSAQGFFSCRRRSLKEEDVYFVNSRQEKSYCIRDIGCTHFIDDLEEVFDDPSFPSGVTKILFGPEHNITNPTDINCAYTWSEVLDLIFSV